MKLDSTFTVGCDLGARKSDLCILDGAGEVQGRRKISTTRQGFEKFFGEQAPVRVVVEATTSSGWVSHTLQRLGHEVIVANPRKVALISRNKQKTDKKDAELLARLGRADPRLLSPIRHRSREAQLDLAFIRNRALLVRTRTNFINHARSIAKCHGERIPGAASEGFVRKAVVSLPPDLRAGLQPILDLITRLNEDIKALDRKLERELPEKRPDIDLLRQVDGVGALTAATFVLTLDDPSRFSKSRKVGVHIGLTPARNQSCAHDPEMRITREGDKYLRCLLVNCAQYILGPFGKDCELRRWGLRLAERGKKNAKKRAAVAVARRLAVLLHRLWVTGEVYQPLGYGNSVVAT